MKRDNKKDNVNDCDAAHFTRYTSIFFFFFFWCAFEKKNKISFPFFNRGDNFKLKKKIS